MRDAGRLRLRTNDAFPRLLATRFPLEDEAVPVNGTGSSILAVVLPFGAPQLPTTAFPSRWGKRCNLGILTCGTLGVPVFGSFALTADGVRDRTSGGSRGVLGSAG
uniref:Syntaxin 4 n=1 Tax=Rousettus aegyptiacus TaxID=9407 RepID=A0A7J8F4E3_ROUAE|nr:syntaxin 4 [Rousettus aegyptiacus]